MATVLDLTNSINGLSTLFAPLPAAIDALEAAVTAALARAGLTPEEQAAINDAFDKVTALTDGLNKAVADATDGIDEGAGGGGPT